MASSKPEMTASRPASVHRPVSSTGPVNVPARNGTPRNHSQSFSLGALNGGHRVARRKSMSNNFAGVAAVVQGMDEASLEALVTPDSQAPANNDAASFQRAGSTSTIRPGTSPNVAAAAAVVSVAGQALPEAQSVAAIDGKLLKSKPGPKAGKVRRASEGAYLSKTEKKRSSSDIRCETCGKGYKHSSCLTKHLWEHTPQWQVTSKLLISKHQQVQMLEAASVLVTMNQNQITHTIETIKVLEDSDRSSVSPMPSDSSALPDEEISSIETSPPPMIEEEEEEEDEDEMDYSGQVEGRESKDHHRYSSTSSVFSHSYQSVPSMAGSIPISTSYSSYHNFGHGRRPSTSGTAYSGMPGEDEAKLAAAVESVSFGTPKSNAVILDGEIPPVPPLPARYASHKATLSGSLLPGFGSELGIMSGPTQRVSDERGGRQLPVASADDRRARRSVSRGHDEQHGMFNMEE